MALMTVLVVIASVLVQTFAFRLTPRLDGRIVGGEAADIKDFPYQLSLQYIGEHRCGASIISGTVTLTAAHCTTGTSVNYLTMRSGTTYHAIGGEIRRVLTIFKHPMYNPFTSDYDASTIKVSQTFNELYKIPLQPIGVNVPDGALAIVTGWGKTASAAPISPNLLKVELSRVSDTKCRSAYEGALTDRMICFGSPGKDSCQGDSGGPLVYNNKQVGIVSWGYACADPKFPGVYTKISDKEIHDHISKYMS